MKFYSKAALQLFYDQINRDNPQLPVLLSSETAAIDSGPTARVSNGRNTQVRLVGYPGRGMQGRTTLYYDRTDFTRLMSGYVPLLYIPPSVKTFKGMLPYVNEALGLTLTESDLSNPNTAITILGTPVSVSLTMAASSPAFTGTLSVSVLCPSVGTYPNSGPGPKELRIGDTMAGYFGRLPATELFSSSELQSLCFTSSAPSLYPGVIEWLKFYYQGGIVYLPSLPITSNTTWNQLYMAGLVYGVDGVGGYPPAGQAVNQSKILIKKNAAGNAYLRPRLPRMGVEPSLTNSAGDARIEGTELELMARLYTGGIWGNLTDAAWTIANWMLNTGSGYPTIGYVATMSAKSISQVLKTASWNWWPVLELVDPATIVLGLEDFGGAVPRTLKAIPFNPVNQISLTPLILNNPKTTKLDTIPATVESDAALNPVILQAPVTSSLKGIPADTEQKEVLLPLSPLSPVTAKIKPIPLTVESYTVVVIPLDTLNGELDGFH